MLFLKVEKLHDVWLNKISAPSKTTGSGRCVRIDSVSLVTFPNLTDFRVLCFSIFSTMIFLCEGFCQGFARLGTNLSGCAGKKESFLCYPRFFFPLYPCT
jgi:hypothetical protein